MRSKLLKAIFSVLVTLVFVYFLLKNIGISKIVSLLSGFPLMTLFWLFVLYGVAYFFRTLRFGYLLKKIPLFTLFNISAIHGLYNNVLPFRTGELSFVFLCSKHVRKTKALSVLILARFFDFVTVLFLFVIMMFSAGLYHDKRLYLFGIAAIVFVIMGIVFVKLSIAHLNKVKSKGMINYIIVKIHETLVNLEELKLKDIFVLFSYSLLIWLSNYIVAYSIVINMGISIGVVKTVLAFTFTTLITTLPIQGLLGFGTTEAAWALAFTFLGVGTELAISSGFGFHLIHISLFTLLGFIGLINHNLFSKDK